MSEQKNQIEDLPQSEEELTPEQAEEVGGGASDFLLLIEGVKGESSDKRTTSISGLTKAGPGTLT